MGMNRRSHEGQSMHSGINIHAPGSLSVDARVTFRRTIRVQRQRSIVMNEGFKQERCRFTYFHGASMYANVS
jgi:hypothetical protein